MPLLIGKFAEQYDQVPMSFMWARIVKRTPQARHLCRRLSKPFSMNLASQLRAKGVTIRLEHAASIGIRSRWTPGSR